jgi:DNA-binding NtrC family response regulator
MEKRTVLFVDDEEKVLTSLKRGLLDESYKTLRDGRT